MNEITDEMRAVLHASLDRLLDTPGCRVHAQIGTVETDRLTCTTMTADGSNTLVVQVPSRIGLYQRVDVGGSGECP